MPLGLTLPQITLFVIIILAFALLVTEKVRRDLVAVLIIIALSVTGILHPEEALSGFSSEPAIVLASIFVLTGALELTGVSQTVGNWIGRWAGNTTTRAIAVLMPAVAAMAAFAEHVTTTAVMLPITVNLSREKNIPVSKLLLPMAFAASLGSAITVVGAPAFLVASGVLQGAGREGLSIFSITPIGIAMSLAGTLFMLLIGQFLLPSHEAASDLLGRFKLDHYFTEMVIRPESPLVGKRYLDIREKGVYRFEVTRWIRGGRVLRVPFADLEFQENDVVLINASPEDLATIRQEAGMELRPVEEYQENVPEKGEDEDVSEQLVQAVIAPSSEMVDRSIGDIDFRNRYGAIVVGLWRQNGFIREEISKVRLHAGDVLVIQGDDTALTKVQADPAFLMMVPFQGEARSPRKAALAAVIMVGTMLLAGLSILPLEIAVLSGAAAVVLTRCITPRQAYRTIDQRIFVFIAGAIPLGIAMEATGASAVVAGWLEGLVAGWSPFWVLLAIFMIVSWITQLMSDAATTALFAPVVLALARALNLPPEPFVVTIAMAAVGAFWTPIGHHGNLLVYAPGRYRFRDFMLVGGLLTLIIGPIVVWVALRLWGGLPPMG